MLDFSNLLISLIDVTPDLVKSIFNYIFIGIIVLIAIGGLIAITRGVWNETFRLIFIGGLVILSYIFAGQIGDKIAAINISSYFPNPIQITDTSNVRVTTISETLQNIIIAMGNAQGEGVGNSIANPDTIALVNELAMMIIRLITFVILAILIITVGNLLATLLYHLLFKHLISHKIRKVFKLRLVALLEGIVRTSLVMSMLIVPFSSLLNSVSKAIKNGNTYENKEMLDKSTYDSIMNFISAYDESYLAKLFSWTADENGNTLDMKLANVITSSGDSQLKFTDELTNILTTSWSFFASGAVSFGKEGSVVLDLSVLFDSAFVSMIISQLTSSSVVMQLLPVAAEVAINSKEIQTFMDTNKVNLENVDWEHDLNAVSSLYSDLYETGIINDDTLTNPEQMLDYLLDADMNNSQSRYEAIVDVMTQLDNIQLLNELLPATIWSLANKQDAEGNYSELHNFVPETFEEFKTIKWGDELATVYDSTYRINKVTNNGLLKYIKNTNNKNQTEQKRLTNTKFEETEDNKTAVEELVSSITDNVNDIIPILVGERNEDGTFKNIDEETGMIKVIDGVRVRCLFDSSLICYGFSSLSSTIVSALLDQFETSLNCEIQRDDIVEAVDSLKTRKDFKTEYAVMLDIVGGVAGNESTKGLLKGEQIEEYTDEMCQSLKESVANVDNSKILSATIPELLKAKLNDESTKESLGKIGIDVATINYDVNSLGLELGKFLDMLAPATRVIKAFSEEEGKTKTLEEKIEATNSSDIKTMLKAIESSDIINHKVEGEKQNFERVFDYVFEIMGYSGKITDSPNLTNVVWTSEIDTLGDFFDTLKTTKITKVLSTDESGNTPDYLDPNVLAPESVSEVFASINDSKTLKEGFGSILDNKLLPQLSSTVTGEGLSFTNIADWKEEGRNFANMLESMQNLKKSGKDLNNLDFLNSDAIDENGDLLTQNLAKALAKSQLFESKYDFGTFLLDKLGSTSTSIDFHDLDDTTKMDKTTAIFHTIADDNKWDEEIDIIFDFLKAVQNVGENDGATDTKGTHGIELVTNKPQDYVDLFTSDGTKTVCNVTNYVGLNNSEALRMVIVNAIKKAINSISVTGMDFDIQDTINLKALVDMDNKAERNEEIDTVCKVMDDFDRIGSKNFATIKANADGELDILKDAMTNVHNSKMLNTLKTGKDLTVFENVAKAFISASGITDEMMTGKVNSTMELRYNNSQDIIKSVPNNYCNETSEDHWIDEYDSENRLVRQGEISKVIEIVKVAQDVDFNNVSSDQEWIKTKAGEIMPLINESELLFRVLPYSVNQFVNNTSTTSFSPSFDLKAAKATYTYDATIKDYVKMNSGSDDSEVELLCVIMSKFSELSNLSAGGFNLQTLKADNKLEDMKEVLKALSISSVFNLEGSNVAGKDTVFIQTMNELCNQSSLANFIYDDTLYHDFYAADGITNASENISKKINDYDAKTKVGSETWSMEIDNLANIFDKVMNMNDTNATLESIENINIDKMSPAQLTMIFNAINESELCYDAVPVNVKRAFTNVSIDSFSKNRENYILGATREESRVMYRQEEINNINDILEGFSTVVYDSEDPNKIDHVEYIKFNDSSFSVTELVETKGKSLTPLIRFLTNSNVFESCRGIVLKNAINSVGFADNIRNDYDEFESGLEIKNVFDKIFEQIENSENKDRQIAFEGNALDSIVKNLEEIIANNNAHSGDSDYNAFTNMSSSTINTILSSCYSGDTKALVSCEIVSGFVSNSIADSEYLDDLYYESGTVAKSWFDNWYYEGLTDFKYPLFNDLERNTITSLVDSIKTIKNIKIEISLGGVNVTNFDNTIIDQISATLGTMEDENGNQSKIGRYLYEKGIYRPLMISNPGVCGIANTGKTILFATHPEEGTSFSEGYARMITPEYADQENENFKFSNVKVEVDKMLRAIMSVAA